MQPERLARILRDLAALRVGVVGDFCLDAYWTLDPDTAERSVETGRPVRKVTSQRYSLGGAGNVAANLAALGVSGISVFGVIGDDPFGREMDRLLARLGVAAGGLIVQPAGWDTPTYCKPHVGAEEQDRIDFGGRNELAGAAADELLAALRAAWCGLDAVIVNQQLVPGLWVAGMIEGFAKLLSAPPPLGRDPKGSAFGAPRPLCVLDSRDLTGRFPPMVWKLNRVEAARLVGVPASPGDTIALDQTRRHAGQIHARTGQPVFVTLGEQGSLVATGEGVTVVPAVRVEGPVDPVGAGDASLAALASALAAGAAPLEAAELANLAAAVTVTKLRQTGTASPEEIRALAQDTRDRQPD